LEKNGILHIQVEGKDIAITREDVEILHEDIKGWVVESDNVLTVALDTELTEELINEGYAREFVNRVQNMRKDAGFSVTDRVRIRYKANEKISKALSSLQSYVKNETLAVEFGESVNVSAQGVQQEINGELCEIAIERV